MKKTSKRILGLALAALLIAVALVGAGAADSSGTCGDNLTWTLTGNNLVITGTGAMYDYEVVGPWGGYITSVGLPDGLTSIGKKAFYYCNLMSSPITIPDSVTSIGASAFQNCSGLPSVTIGNSVTSIGNSAFSGCEGLTSVTIPNSVTSIGNGAFYGCEKLTSVTIPDSVTSIGRQAFCYCTRLTEINVNANNPNYSSDSGVLFDKNQKTLIQYPADKNGVSYIIPDSVTSIGTSAFNGCEKLTSVTIGNSVTSIGNGAFYNCTNLTSVTIPDSVTSIGTSAFNGCEKLTSVTIGNSVTSIGNGAFEYCSSLTSVTIPDSVTSIGSYAFDYCSGLMSVTIPSSVTSIGKSAFSSTAAVKDSNVITLPAVTNGKWIDTTDNVVATVINNSNASHAFKVEYNAQPQSSVTSFFGKKDGSDFVFDRAVVITKATLPGATYATVTNTSGSGWYTCNLSTDSITGNGILYFQVPLDVIDIKGWTVNDVSMLGCKTTYLKSENGYAKYSAVITKGGALTIDFEKDAATAAVEKVQEVVEQKQTEDCKITISGASSLNVGEKFNLSAACTCGKVHNFNWKVNDPTVATVTELGVLNGLKAGTVTVTVTDECGHSATKVINVAAKAAEQTAAKSPFPVLGILAGLGAAAFFLRRR